MKCRRLFIWYLLVLFCPAICAAQPMLPAITGAADGGVALLAWVCQYDGVKAITVKRSADSLANYSIVGYVKNTAKGLQAFADGQPLAGNNFYKLNIAFN